MITIADERTGDGLTLAIDAETVIIISTDRSIRITKDNARHIMRFLENNL